MKTHNMDHEQKIKNIVNHLDITLTYLEDDKLENKTYQKKYLFYIQTLLDICNTALLKRNLITKTGLNFGKALLNHKEYKDRMNQIDFFMNSNLKNFSTHPEILCKYAEFLSNRHYALFLSFPNNRELAMATLKNHEHANKIIDGVLKGPCNKPGDTAMMHLSAQLASQYWIPILASEIRILIIMGDHEFFPRLQNATSRTMALDSVCMNILKRPGHIYVAIIQGIFLAKSCQESQDSETLLICLEQLDTYHTQFQAVYLEDNVTRQWSQSSKALMIMAECRGHCLLKLKRFEEAYHVFEEIVYPANQTHDHARAARAKFNQAQALRGARHAEITLSNPEWTTLKFIQVLLTEAETLAARLPAIKEKIHAELDQIHTEIFLEKMESPALIASLRAPLCTSYDQHVASRTKKRQHPYTDAAEEENNSPKKMRLSR